VTAILRMQKDEAFSTGSGYRWINVEIDGTRVGKARIRVSGRMLVINSINIFPEFQNRGYGRKVIDAFKHTYRRITADRVRNTARGFWKKMGFVRRPNGNYVWEKEPKP